MQRKIYLRWVFAVPRWEARIETAIVELHKLKNTQIFKDTCSYAEKSGGFMTYGK